jgi:hypothetical protein
MIPHGLARGVWGNVLKNVENIKINPKIVKNHSYPHHPCFGPRGNDPPKPSKNDPP